MKFDCNKIKITEDNLTCEIIFCDYKNNQLDSLSSSSSVFDCSSNYLILKRAYAETNLEEDYVYIETPEPENSGEFNNIQINVYRNNLLLSYEKKLIDVNLKINNEEFNQLEFILKKIIGGKGFLHFSNT